MAVYGMPKGKTIECTFKSSLSSEVLKMIVLFRQSFARAKGKLKEEACTL
jgi:hypothetical protein